MQRFLAYSVLVATIYLGVSFILASVVVDYRDPVDRNDPEWRAIYAPDSSIPLSTTVDIMNGSTRLVADIYEHPYGADCAVVVAHGLRGDRQVARLYGSMFYNIGCDVLGYDFAPRNNPDALLTYGYQEKSDLAAVVDWLADHTDLPKSQIGIWGGSYGAATTLQYLADEQQLAFVIADSSYASMPRILDEQAHSLFGSVIKVVLPATYFIIEQRLGFDMDIVSPEQSVRDNDVPLLLLHAPDDNLIASDNSRAIYQNANPDSTRLIYTGWGSAHMQSYIENPDTYTHYVYSFLRKFAPDFSAKLDSHHQPSPELSHIVRADTDDSTRSFKQLVTSSPATPPSTAIAQLR